MLNGKAKGILIEEDILFFVKDPFELTTAITDIFLGASAFYVFLKLKEYKDVFWRTGFLLIGVAAFLGAYIHGVALFDSFDKYLWIPLLFCIFMAVALFWIGTLEFVFSKSGKILKFIFISISLIMFLGSFFVKEFFVFFILYELSSFLIMAILHAWRGNFTLFLGMLVSMIAGFIQTQRQIKLQFVFPLDHNGIFHIIQIIANFILYAGIRSFYERQKT